MWVNVCLKGGARGMEAELECVAGGQIEVAEATRKPVVKTIFENKSVDFQPTV